MYSERDVKLVKGTKKNCELLYTLWKKGKEIALLQNVILEIKVNNS